MKEKAKKFFKVARIVLIILLIIGLAISVSLNTAMYSILEEEEEYNSEFFELKVAIAECYLSGKGGLIGNDKTLYQDYVYSDSKVSLNKAKWIASKINLESNYTGKLKIPFSDEISIRIDNQYLQWIIDNQANRQPSFVMGGDPIEVFMHYDTSEKLFIIELNN